MLNLITGVPGTGKTAYLIDTLKDVSDRTIYYRGIPELKLPWIPLIEPINWYEEVDEGSIIVMDEVQEVFPIRNPRIEVPEGLKALERHRHKGLDLYFLTQHPGLVDAHARKLIGLHVHLRRPFNRGKTYAYKNNGLIEVAELDKSSHYRNKLDKQEFKLTNKNGLFDLYKSTVLDTHKFIMPKKLKRIMVIVPVLILVIYFSISHLVGSFMDTGNLAMNTVNQIDDFQRIQKKEEPVIQQVIEPEFNYSPDWRLTGVVFMGSKKIFMVTNEERTLELSENECALHEYDEYFCDFKGQLVTSFTGRKVVVHEPVRSRRERRALF